MQHLFQGNPIDNLDAYRQFNESTFLVDVQRWSNSKDAEIALLGSQWQSILHRDSSWKMSAERTINFHSAMNAQTTIFSEKELVAKRLRSALPAALQDIPLRLDVARHYHRPSARLPAGGQNWLLTPGYPEPVELMDDELFRTLPVSFLIFRVYSHDHSHDADINAALESVLGAASDSKTNM